MTKTRHPVQKFIFTLAIFALIFGGSIPEKAAAETAATAASSNAVVYYLSDDDSLYRVKTDGSPSEKMQDSFEGYKVRKAGNYMYYYFDDENTSITTLQRISLSAPLTAPSNFGGDKEILYYDTSGNYVYYMNEDGNIYRALGDASSNAEAKLIADHANTEFPNFSIINGRIYYNALKDGYTTWAASKAADGSGNVQWIASGAVEGSFFVHTYNSTLYLMVNTNPAETQYSTDCVVLYYLPINGGTAKAVNAKAPLDVNAVYSGSWINDGYVYNKGIRLNSEKEYDYTLGKGHIITKSGTTFPLNKTGVYDIVNSGTNKLAYVDAYGKAHVSTIANNKVTSTKTIQRTNVSRIINLMNNGKVKSTILFAGSGTYVLNNDLSTKKLEGIEWDNSTYEEGIPGIFYANSADNYRLYRMNDDGKTSVKLTDDKVSSVLLITKP
ncbi:hypothetical protein FHR92_002257 [Fontibacillus solani]|uniref:Prolow-density lipoprotein receptor-related protein 1-like beta-propeller domain-containing protein n=1 Tax=Fontibacillus solani TaxID=1572857 RepID=A0A7W3XRS4_9BACL|nr:DUF5050 domain-containing protein [Fontibacillus solani]MBA9085790.1 hypothetical protein [Fontibacillus solani]